MSRGIGVCQVFARDLVGVIIQGAFVNDLFCLSK